MATSLPLPLAPEALTASWFTAALAPAYPGSVVRSARVVDVIAGTSTKIRVALAHNAETPPRPVARRRLRPKADAGYRSCGKLTSDQAPRG